MNFREKAKALVAQMTIEEKAALCSGKNFWYLKGIPRLDLPEIMVTDGPHGLRKQKVGADHLGINESVPAVCFPTSAATACSFDRELLGEIGAAMGEECRQENVAVILGPGINIKRSPLCGRNFEYISEDPYLTGELAAALIKGVQSQNVGVSVKHFAANNQEKRRMTAESVMDERTLREIYLAGFERAVRKAKPWTMMCAYNRVSGEFASQNKRLLTDILRDEWGFDGVVMSDWGATVDRIKALEAGLELEMPHTGPANDARIVWAVKNGLLSEATLDTAAERLVTLILRSTQRQPFNYDATAHHLLARRAAAQSAVLLKNEGNILPGKPTDRAAVIGAFARQPRYQGTGSSKISPIKVDVPLEELQLLGLSVEYAQGYHLVSDAPDAELIAEACRVAAGKDIVYLFAGLPDSYEAEAFDRTSMAMPQSHVRLIEAVCEVNPKVVVILQGGSVMELPWADRVPGILLMYLGGEATGGASADLLLGVSNPCGKLAESWPFAQADNPAHENFPGYPLTVEYREGLFVGYRFYDTAHKAVRYPFGYGLSYTHFDYSDLKVSRNQMLDTDEISVRCTVSNTGQVAGSEIVQLYVARKESVIIRPEQELKGFEKVYLQPGERCEVSFTLSKRDFAYYNTTLADWHVESGDYEIRISASSREMRLSTTLQVESTTAAVLPDFRTLTPSYYDLSNGVHVPDEEFAALLGKPIPARYRTPGTAHTINSTITDIQDKWLGRQLANYMRKQTDAFTQGSPDLKLMIDSMMVDMPLRSMSMMAGEGSRGLTITQVEGLVEMLNGHWIKGLRLFRAKKSV